MQIFGIRRNARDYRSWTYIDAHREHLPQTIENIAFAVDLSMQPHLTEDNVRVMGRVLREVVDHVMD